MTRIEFYFNVADKLAKATELCERAVAKGRQLTLFTQDDAMSIRLQQKLWQHSPASFLPSAYPLDDTSAQAPIVLDAAGTHLIQDDILINLKTEHPPFFSRFRYLVELVGNDEDDKVAARQRYKFYRDRGYQVKSTDAAAG
ncbi:MAG TPA: DNA polymerase III subunit chi [Methylotenera sp.]